MKMEDNDEELDFLEEDEKGKKVMLIASGVVVVVVAAILCFFLWKLFHPASAEGDDGTVSAQESVQPGGEAQGASDPDGQVKGTQDGGGVTSPAAGTDGTGEGAPGGDAGGAGAGAEGAGTGAEGAGTAGIGSGTGAGTGGEDPAGVSPSKDAGSAENGGDSGNTGSGAADGSAGQDDANPLDMQFQEALDTVTAKDVTNLRSEPSTARDDTVVTKLKNGETAARTGINPDLGWSRLEYNGQTLYAVTNYLTTDLSPKKAAGGSTGDAAGTGGSSGSRNSVQTKDGRTVSFTDCDDYVSPKMEVNLRGEPSTSEGNATIHVRLPYGEKVHRTGYSGTGSTEEDGWSRVEYNGEILYAKTSFMFVVDESQQEE